jgi:hypothetical protein
MDLCQERANRHKEGKIAEQIDDTRAQEILNGTTLEPQENRL